MDRLRIVTILLLSLAVIMAASWIALRLGIRAPIDKEENEVSGD
jgi:hypothetical protein